MYMLEFLLFIPFDMMIFILFKEMSANAFNHEVHQNTVHTLEFREENIDIN